MNKITDSISKILPDRDVKEYFLKICALCMTKNTQLQKIWILTGEGSNGKSFIMGLLSKTLGKFSKPISPAIITRKAENVNESNDALSKMEFIRHMLISEPGDDDIIQAEKVKSLCGGLDQISVRGLFREQKEYLPEFKCILLCNQIPKLSGNTSSQTYSIWRRIRLIDFPVKFCENPNPNNPLEKLIDINLESNVKLWAPYFAGYLVHWLKIIKDSGGFSEIVEPDAVKRRTERYREDIDIFKDFVNENLVRENEYSLEWSAVKARLFEWLADKDARTRNFVKSKSISEIQQALTIYLGIFHKTKIDYQNFRGYIGWNLLSINTDS